MTQRHTVDTHTHTHTHAHAHAHAHGPVHIMQSVGQYKYARHQDGCGVAVFV